MVSPTPSQVTVRPDSEGLAGYRPGDVIGQKYQLVRMLGEGGMGSIWLAHNLPLDADVAIKVMRADASSPDAAGRLLTEARAAARLRHPSIVRIFDLGRTDRGEPFIVMEVLEGESLGAVLDRKLKLAEENAVQTLLPVIAGLVAAHEQGVIHRDVKPENIVLSVGEGGRLVPKLVDFGVVKFSDCSPFNSQADEIEGSPTTCRPSRRAAAQTSTSAPTSGRCRSCSTRCSRARAPSRARMRPRSSTRSGATRLPLSSTSRRSSPTSSCAASRRTSASGGRACASSASRSHAGRSHAGSTPTSPARRSRSRGSTASPGVRSRTRPHARPSPACPRSPAPRARSTTPARREAQPDTCPSLAAAFDALAVAHARREDLDGPLGSIRRAVHCALKSGGDAHYAYHEAPQGSAEPLLRHALEQAALEQAAEQPPPR